MRYTAPKLVATYAATSVIKSEKGEVPFEVNQITLTNSPAYHSAE
jgi:hypothetical protein